MEEIEEWIPRTKLGNMVKNGKVTDMRQTFELGLPIMEHEIVDTLVPDLEEEVIDISLVQRMHKSGRRIKFRATVAIGNRDGYVGLGKAKAKEVGPAIRKAITEAKLNLIHVNRGCGSWECRCKSPHSVPMKVTGKASSVEITLLPAPRGIGLVSGEVSKKILKLAGIKDIWSKSRGQTQSTINSAKATFEALRQTLTFKTVKDEEPIEEPKEDVKEKAVVGEERRVKKKPEKETKGQTKEKKESKKSKEEAGKEIKETGDKVKRKNQKRREIR